VDGRAWRNAADHDRASLRVSVVLSLLLFLR
jgi:hypothetical protein